MKEAYTYQVAFQQNVSTCNQERLNELSLSLNRYKLKYLFKKNMVEDQRKEIRQLEKQLSKMEVEINDYEEGLVNHPPQVAKGSNIINPSTSGSVGGGDSTVFNSVESGLEPKLEPQTTSLSPRTIHY